MSASRRGKARVRRVAIAAACCALALTVAATTRIASSSASVPSYSARPITQPANPAAANLATSSSVVTPPDATIGTSTAACISAIAGQVTISPMPRSVRMCRTSSRGSLKKRNASRTPCWLRW